MNEMISLGTCPTCGGPAQFIEGGTIRHVPLHRDQLERVTEAMQSDVAELLRALGLGDHARDKSPHEIMQLEILPAVRLRDRA